MKTIVPLILILLLFSTSCIEEETCRESKEVVLQASLLALGSTTAKAIDSLTLYGLDNDSVLYINRKLVSKITLPLKNQDDLSIFVCKFNTVYDTLMVFHTNKEYFISFACGTIITHEIDTVLTTNNYIKSIAISQKTVNTTNVQHIQIYH
ncbi:MAG: hypothetical protein K9G42_13715 [Pedobacter sp.]|nr:hypothetical protein [Pedobacter sp.]